MKNILTLLVAMLSFAAFSQTLAPFNNDGKWGYMNQKGEVIIETQYRNAFPFSTDGIAVVLTMQKKWAYINSKNEELTVSYGGFIPDKKGFHNGLATVIVRKKKGVINTKGEEVFAPEYDLISVFSDGFATAKKGKSFFILDNKGNAKEITEKMVKVNRFTNGLAPFLAPNDLFGFINTKGEVVIEAQFYGVGHFKSDLTWARNSDKKIGFINQKGEWMIQPKYLAAKAMSPKENLARVKNENGWLFVSASGNEIKTDGVIAYGDFSDGLAWARDANKKIGFINQKGEWVIQPAFTTVRKFSNGLCAVKNENKWGFINKKGEWTIPSNYLRVKDFILIP